jgi:hypothetical protein
MVVAYSFRPGVVTTDDFEYELIVPPPWIDEQVEKFCLRHQDDEYTAAQLDRRRQRANEWYAPKSRDQYDLYRDCTSRGYVHMLVERTAQPDGRRRVFISKH